MNFDHNYYNNSLKYTFSITSITVNIKSDIFLKDFFSKFEDIGK